MGLFSRKAKDLGEDISNLKQGTQIEITSITDKECKFISHSKLEEFTKKDELLISLPISDGNVVKLSKNMEYSIVFKTPNGIFKNFMVVKEYFSEGNNKYVRIKLSDKTRKLQRRESYRFEVSTEIDFDIVKEKIEETFFSEIPLLLKGESVDISSGGVKFLSNEELEEGNLIKIKFALGEKTLYAIGTILHLEVLENKNFNYEYKLKFEMINRDSIEYISKYIFDKQRELLKTMKKN